MSDDQRDERPSPADLVDTTSSGGPGPLPFALLLLALLLLVVLL